MAASSAEIPLDSAEDGFNLVNSVETSTKTTVTEDNNAHKDNSQSSNADNAGPTDLTEQASITYATLLSMGFPSAECEIAARLHNNADRAMNWILLDDKEKNKWTENIQTLASLGFSTNQAASALVSTNNILQPATDKLLNGAANKAKSQEQPKALQSIASSASTAATSSQSSNGSCTNAAKPPAEYTVSDEEVKSELLVQKAVWMRDTDTLSEYCKRGLQDQVDHHNNTPLVLAHRLGYNDLVTFLLNRGADPRIKTGRGWTLLQEAALLHQEAMCIDIHMHTLLLKQKLWEQNLAQLVHTLKSIPDFYMEIDW
jgi:Holliday junction resolvasome RuvABC DNA-binding subunit